MPFYTRQADDGGRFKAYYYQQLSDKLQRNDAVNKSRIFTNEAAKCLEYEYL